MLQFESLRPDTLAVLKLTMAEPLLNEFTLVGGTALALHFGHRISEDIDLFSWTKFDIDNLINELSKKTALAVKMKTPIGAHVFIENVKTDFVYFPIKPIRDTLLVDGTRLLAVEDIAAMKLNAIANRGAKKDFYDLFYLLQFFGAEKLVELFKEKFSTQDVFGLIRSMIYFEEADNEATEITVLKDKKLKWGEVKESIITSTKHLF